MNEPSQPHAATVIYADGAVDTVALPDGDNARIQKLVDLIGAEYIQAIPISNSRYMLVDENGKLQPHIHNQAATDIAHKAEAIPVSDYIAGTAVIVTRAAVL